MLGRYTTGPRGNITHPMGAPADGQAESRPGLFETIYTTRALRRFKPDPIPAEVLFQLFPPAPARPRGFVAPCLPGPPTSP